MQARSRLRLVNKNVVCPVNTVTSGRRHADVVMRPSRRVDALYDVQTTHSGTADG